MKTTFIFLIFALLGFTSQQTVIAGPGDLQINEVIETTTCSAQPDPAVSELKDLLTDLGFEIDDLEFEDGVDEESCTIIAEGTIDGRKVSLKVTFVGISCAELISSLK